METIQKQTNCFYANNLKSRTLTQNKKNKMICYTSFRFSHFQKRNGSLKKRKGTYHGEFVFDFLKQKQFFIICHTNSMQLETYLPLRNELKKIDFNLKFLKRKTVLNYFDQQNNIKKSNSKTERKDKEFAKKPFKSQLQDVFNGSIAIIYPKRFSRSSNNVNIRIFEIIETTISKTMKKNGSTKEKGLVHGIHISNQKLIMLGFFLNDFYLISKGKKIFNKSASNLSYETNGKTIESVSNILKVSSIFLTLTSLIQKFYKLSQPWTKLVPIAKSLKE